MIVQIKILFCSNQMIYYLTNKKLKINSSNEKNLFLKKAIGFIHSPKFHQF